MTPRRYKIGAADRTAYLTGKPSTWSVFDNGKEIASGFTDSEAAKKEAERLEAGDFKSRLKAAIKQANSRTLKQRLARHKKRLKAKYAKSPLT